MHVQLRDQLAARGLSPRTVEQYLREIARAEAFMRRRDTTLLAAGADDVAAYAAEVVPRSWSSMKRAKDACRHFWELSERPGAPLWGFPKLVRPKWPCRALEEAEAADLEASARARDDDKGLVVLLGLHLGLRREEIAELRWDCFAGDGWAQVLGKGGRTRFLFVHPVLTEALLSARRRRAGSSPFVFPGRFAGRPIVVATVWDWCRQVAVEAGCESLVTVPPHRLRHTCIATINDATGDLRAAQEHAGHARPETTATYTRATRRRLKAAAMALDYAAVAAAALSDDDASCGCRCGCRCGG